MDLDGLGRWIRGPLREWESSSWSIGWRNLQVPDSNCQVGIVKRGVRRKNYQRKRSVVNEEWSKEEGAKSKIVNTMKVGLPSDG